MEYSLNLDHNNKICKKTKEGDQKNNNKFKKMEMQLTNQYPLKIINKKLGKVQNLSMIKSWPKSKRLMPL